MPSLSDLIATLNTYIPKEYQDRVQKYGVKAQQFVKDQDDLTHGVTAAAFAAFLWLNGSLNLVAMGAGFAAQKCYSPKVIGAAQWLRDTGCQSKTMKFAGVISLFAIATLCPWLATSFGFGFYAASEFQLPPSATPSAAVDM